jgi:hypothetical protein
MITLTTPTQVTASGLLASGVASETDNIAGVSHFTVDFIAGTISFELVLGQLLNGNVNIGVYVPRIEVTVNLATGAWTTSTGLSGTIASASLTSVISQFASDRNLMEAFAAGSSGILPGTQTAWASTSV